MALLQSTVRDCLYLNWALPLAALPAPPRSLRWERQATGGGERVMASLVLFRRELRSRFLRGPLRATRPECALRVCVLDETSVPGALVPAMLAPWWSLPAARLLAGQPLRAARLRFDQPSRSPEAEGWRFRVGRGGRLDLTVRRAATPLLTDPELGGFARAVEHLSRRPLGFIATPLGLRRFEVESRPVPVWPLAAEVARQDLLDQLLPLAAGEPWPALHSAFLLPELELVWELLPTVAQAMAQHLPAAS